MSDLHVIDSWPKNGRGENVRIALTTFKDTRLIDARITVDLSAVCNVQTPTPKGLSIRVEHLPRLIDALIQADFKAKELGWLGPVCAE